MTQRERMDAGLIYDSADAEIEKEQTGCLEKLYDFNATRPSEMEKRQALLKEMFGSIGEHCYIEPPLRANWGGKHCYFEDYVYANFNLTMVDDGNIYVGEKTMFGPNVCVATANHPINKELRAMCLDWRKCGNLSGGYHRRLLGNRRRKRCDKGYSRQCGCLRKSLQGGT